ncbi:MAG: ATP-binding cassette domain-containing protein [Ferruginibacter sp.]|nr:ATP-binding cassette domain-containing protein [Ferruginibacter sp.]
MEPVLQHKEVVLDVSNLCKSFGNNHVLRNFSLRVLKGENVVVVGKSGSGKSVLIKCIIGLMMADSGTVILLGKDVSLISVNELDKIRARVGFLFQSNALYDSMTVRENLLFPLRRHWLKRESTDEESLVREALANVGLEHTLDMMPAELSGGMRKRIALARTLILKPQLILYDEPTTGLDPITSREIIALMNTISKKYNAASVIISHDMNCIKMAADRVVMLIDGRCYAEGNYESLKKHDDAKVAAFFEGE